MNTTLSTTVRPQMIESREVAEMLEMRHADLLRKVDGYIDILRERNFAFSDYFVESTYKSEGNTKNYPCYLFTKMGCEFIANKFTGEKGILFTAKYVKKFNQMESNIPHLISELEQAKIEAQKARAEAMLLNAKNRTFKTLMTSIADKNLSPIAVQVFGLKGLESVFGVDVGNCLPQMEKTYSATEIGEILGITANKVGRLAKEYNLKTKEYGLTVMDKSKYSSKDVPSFRYFEKVVPVLKAILEQTKPA